MVDDRDLVRQPLGLVHEVRGENHRHAGRAQFADQVPGRVPGLRVESRPWARPGRPARDGRPRRRPGPSRCCWPPDSRLYGVRAASASPTRTSRPSGSSGWAWKRGSIPERTPGAGTAGGTPPDCSITPIRGRRARASRAGSRPRTRTVPAVGPAVALADLDGGGLAGAVGTQDGGHLAGCGAQRQPVHRDRVPVPLHQARQFEGGNAAHVCESMGGRCRPGRRHRSRRYQCCLARGPRRRPERGWPRTGCGRRRRSVPAGSHRAAGSARPSG